MKKFIVLLLLCGCSLTQPRTLTYAYKYKCDRCVMKDSSIYSDVLYYPGDTIIILPSKKVIVITDISFTKH